MLETLVTAPADKILALSLAYKKDTRPNRIDLGVGVFKDATGNTPIMAAVKVAEQRILTEQTTKAYLGVAGDAEFNQLMAKQVLGSAMDQERARVIQTVGGTGALRMLADLVHLSSPNATVWVPDPTWPNHLPILRAAQCSTQAYPYFEEGRVCFDAMMETLKQVPAGDVVLLHGCCHNPTGANLTLAQWKIIGDICAQRGLIPFVDIAYQGFGDGLDEDAAGVRLMASMVPEMLVAASCSKNFGIYRERTGIAIVIGNNAAVAQTAQSQILSIARATLSMPPDHGAACVRIILSDNALRAQWLEELDQNRNHILSLRQGFANALRQRLNDDRFDFIAENRGMFSRLMLTPEQVVRLREEYAIYMVADSRINVAGLNASQLQPLSEAIAAVL